MKEKNKKDSKKSDKNTQKDAKIQAEAEVVKQVKEEKKIIEVNVDYKDQYLRLVAEFDNARKRMEREKLDFVKYANEGIIVEFLGIMDDLERTVQAARTSHKEDTAFLKGLDMVVAHINKMLEKNDVKPIETVGKQFDPLAHEVLMQQETSEHKDGEIVEEFQKGFRLGDRVVRTSKVKVAKFIGKENK